MTGSKPLTIEEKMADALRAAAPHIAAATTVVDHDMVTVLREGSTADDAAGVGSRSSWDSPG
jgi:hypothetical protein